MGYCLNCCERCDRRIRNFFLRLVKVLYISSVCLSGVSALYNSAGSAPWHSPRPTRPTPNETAEGEAVPISENAAASSSSGTPLLDLLATGNPYVPHYAAVSGAADSPANPTVSSRLPPLYGFTAGGQGESCCSVSGTSRAPCLGYLYFFFWGGSTHCQKNNVEYTVA